MAREGYLVEAREDTGGDGLGSGPGPVLLLASPRMYDGLYVLETRDLAETLRSLTGDGEPGLPAAAVAAATGMYAYLPRPFGVEDVLRAVQAVSGFDGRRKFTEGPR